MSRLLPKTPAHQPIDRVSETQAGHKQRNDRSFLRLGIILSSLLVGITVLAWYVADNEIAHDSANEATTAQLSAQRTTDALAEKTRTLFGSLDSLVGLSSLILQLNDCCDATAKQVAQRTIDDAMQQSPLSVRALRLIAPSGQTVLEVGKDPADMPSDAGLQVGVGLPWSVLGGRHVAHVMRTLPNNPGYALRLNVDIDTLSHTANGTLGPGMEVGIYRLSDGAALTTFAEGGRQWKAADLEPLRVLDSGLLGIFANSDRGWISSDPKVHPASPWHAAFSTLHELGLVVITRVRLDQTSALSQRHSQAVQLLPLAVFLMGLISVSGILLVVSRQRSKLEWDDQQRLSVAEAAARWELEQLVSCSPAMLYRGRINSIGEFKRDFLSPNTREVTGWEASVLADPEELWNLTPDEDRRVRNRNYIQAAQNGRAACEYRFQRPDGGYSWLRNEAMVVRQLPDGSTELAGAITNISREREMSAYAAMQNRLASLGEISASLAHELTQPMTVIGIACALAQNAARTATNHDDLDRHLTAIATQTERASDIIRHLRLYGRADGGPMANIKLRQAVQGALSLVGTSLRESDVEVSLDIPEDLPLIRARLVQIEQILINLMINARDAMSANPPGSRRIIMRGSLHNGMTRLQVEDTGPGVPSSLIERMFEPFYTTKAPGEGTGLGLALCQTMMRQFGGTISAANGRYGAIFTLDFPKLTQSPDQLPATPLLSAEG